MGHVGAPLQFPLNSPFFYTLGVRASFRTPQLILGVNPTAHLRGFQLKLKKSCLWTYPKGVDST